jgi:hypothetical protein
MFNTLSTRRVLLAGACVYGSKILFPKIALAEGSSTRAAESDKSENSSGIQSHQSHQSHQSPQSPQSLDDIRKRFQEANKKDEVLVRNTHMKEIIEWEAVKNNKLPIASKVASLNNDIMQELSFMSSFYSKPLKPEKKITARNTLISLYERSKVQDERDVIISIMEYFELFE